MCTVTSSRQTTAPQTPVTRSRRNSTTTFSTTLGLAKMLNERGIKAVTPSCVATPCGDKSFSPTATPCNSPDGTPSSSPPPSPPPYNPLKFPGNITIAGQNKYLELNCNYVFHRHPIIIKINTVISSFTLFSSNGIKLITQKIGKERENSYRKIKRSPNENHTQTHGNLIEIC